MVDIPEQLQTALAIRALFRFQRTVVSDAQAQFSDGIVFLDGSSGTDIDLTLPDLTGNTVPQHSLVLAVCRVDTNVVPTVNIVPAAGQFIQGAGTLNMPAGPGGLRSVILSGIPGATGSWYILAGWNNP